MNDNCPEPDNNSVYAGSIRIVTGLHSFFTSDYSCGLINLYTCRETV